jgi:hypothetical protein
MSVKIICPGHKPWEAETYVGELKYHSGNSKVKKFSMPPKDDKCYSKKPNESCINNWKQSLLFKNAFKYLYAR